MFVGRHCGSKWREDGLAEAVLEEAARSWKKGDGQVIVGAEGDRLKGILKALEGSMAGGRVVVASVKGTSSLRRESSDVGTSLEKLRVEHTRPSALRNDSQDSLGMSTLEVDADDTDEHENGSQDIRSWLKVIGAFEQPRLLFNPARKHFEKVATPRSLLAAPEAKTEIFRQRYHLIQQRLLRNEAFQTPTIARQGSQTAPSWRVTSIANLLGRSGTGHLLLGLLAIAPTGTLAISDLTGTIQLDLEQATWIDETETWLCPGMIVLVDGIYEEDYNCTGGSLAGVGGVGGTIGGRFVGFSVGAPRCETRTQSLGLSDVEGDNASSIGGGFGWVDFLGVGSERAAGSRMRRLEQRLLRDDMALSNPAPNSGHGKVVMLGQSPLGNPRTLLALRKIFTAYVDAATNGAEADLDRKLADMLPTAFVFFGSFVGTAAMSSTSSGHDNGNASSIGYKEGFDSLATLLHDFPQLMRHCKFIFVPGDNDPWPSASSSGASCPLPRSNIPDLFTGRLKREFASANADTNSRSKESRNRSYDNIHGESIWTSNPSRVTLFGTQQELVLFRDDVSGRLRRNAIPLKPQNQVEVQTNADDDADSGVAMSSSLLPAEDSNDVMEVDAHANLPTDNDTSRPQADVMDQDLQHARRLTKILLDQTHLSPYPLSVRPLHWAHSHVLSLYPLPSALILCDAEVGSFSIVYQGCCVVNTGRLLGPTGHGSSRERACWAEYDLRTRRAVVKDVTV